MNKVKGFTLVELMVVILIVSILAAVAIPILSGRIDAAKWSEGKVNDGYNCNGDSCLSCGKGPERNGADCYCWQW